MRPFLLALAALFSLGAALALLSPAPGTTGVVPNLDVTAHDLDLRALRVVSGTVNAPDGSVTRPELAVLGPAERILEPWLRVELTAGAIELRTLDGAIVPVPPGSAVAWWDASAGAWAFSPEPLGDLSRLPDLSRGGTLPDALRTAAPERADLIDRAFPVETR